MKNTNLPILDLRAALQEVPAGQKKDRLQVLSTRFPGAHIVAVGGVPIEKRGDRFYLGDTPLLDMAAIEYQITCGIGLSALLTHTNPNNKSLKSLGTLCEDLNHTWAYNWMSISMLLCGYGPGCELAFTRDTRFYMSWATGVDPGLACVANGSISAWRKFVKNQDDPSFHLDARRGMKDCSEILQAIGVIQ